MKVLPIGLLCLMSFTAADLNALDLLSEQIEPLDPEAVCQEAHQVRQDTILYSDCKGFDYINQRVVKDSMPPADFAQFLAGYELGADYQTNPEQQLLNWFEAAISPFDPTTRVSQDGHRFLFRTQSRHIFFEFDGSEWKIQQAALAPKS